MFVSWKVFLLRRKFCCYKGASIIVYSMKRRGYDVMRQE